jgi:hypothetical protein
LTHLKSMKMTIPGPSLALILSSLFVGCQTGVKPGTRADDTVVLVSPDAGTGDRGLAGIKPRTDLNASTVHVVGGNLRTKDNELELPGGCSVLDVAQAVDSVSGFTGDFGDGRFLLTVDIPVSGKTNSYSLNLKKMTVKEALRFKLPAGTGVYVVRSGPLW